MLSLPAGVCACLSDLDGVVTPTAAAHAAAWKETFDDVLRAAHSGEESAPFDPVSDYAEYVDGKPHVDGTRPLASRRITLSEGRPDNPPTREMIHGLSTRKDEGYSRQLRGGVKPFEIRCAIWGRRGLRHAVVSSSKNCAEPPTHSSARHACFGVEPEAAAAVVRGPAGRRRRWPGRQVRVRRARGLGDPKLVRTLSTA